MERDGMEVRVMPCMHCDIPLGGRGVPLRETGPNSACLVRGMRGAQTSFGFRCGDTPTFRHGEEPQLPPFC